MKLTLTPEQLAVEAQRAEAERTSQGLPPRLEDEGAQARLLAGLGRVVD